MRISTAPYVEYTSKLECTKRSHGNCAYPKAQWIVEKEMALPMLLWILGSAHGKYDGMPMGPVNGAGQCRG